MAKNSFCYRADLPEDQENIINHHNCHTGNTASTLEELPTNALQCQGCPVWSIEGFAEDRTISSTKSHRQAEKRRRDRINAQLARLRKLIPNSEKMDKATLLERVVEQVKDLKEKASEVSQLLTIPTEIDDITIECHTNIQQRCQNFHDKTNENMLIKVTLCCEDRPDLIAELIRALKDLNLTTIEADIACLGGRMKTILVLCTKNNGVGDKQGIYNVSVVKQSLMTILTRMISWSTAPNFRVTSKRQRFFFSS